MPCDINKIDSNLTGLAFAEEECLKQLPGTEGADAIWYGLEPNSYSDFGGEISMVARSPIDPSRQNKKGTVTDLEASGGFNIDFTQNNLLRLLQGFFFADAREVGTTKPLNAAQVVLTGVVAADKDYTAASGLGVFAAGDLLLASGFSAAANNGLKTVVSAAAGAVEVAETAVDETPTSAAILQAVGYQFASGDLDIEVNSGIPSLVSTLTDFTDYPKLIPGAWIFIGGDATGLRFANNVGFARIKTVTAGEIVFDDTTFTPAAEVGTGKTIQIFIGTILKNENVANLIKRRSYQIERQLGMGATDIQAEYLEGAVANELTLNIPQADKLNADLTFVALDNTHRSGEVDDEIKVGTRVSALGEDAFNTSSDVYRIKMAVHSASASNPLSLFGYVSEASVSINNNVTSTKAVGVLGAFDTTAGNFEVGGSVTAFFTNVAAIQAVRNNADVGMSVIFAARNAGFIFDIPLLSLGGGRLNVEKDAPITVPLEPAGAENENGYTMLYENFAYLPTVAMP